MKLSRVLLLWTLPAPGQFFLFKGAFASAPADMSKNTASTRMTYGRFLNTRYW